MRRASRALWGICACVLTAALAGYAAESMPIPMHRRYAIFEPTLTCEEANRISHRALERLGYKVTSFTPAPTGGEGVIRGLREGPLEQIPVTVKITCGADGVHVDTDSDIPPCEQANRIMYRTVEGLGYQVTSFTPAPEGGEGVVKGTREGSRGQETVNVKITCGADAIYMDTGSDNNPLLSSKDFYLAIIDFPRGFYAWFKTLTEDVRRENEKMSRPQGQVQVVMKPLVGLETKHEFGTEVTQVLPVRVEVFNTTGHAYLLEADKIVLFASSGEQVKSLNANSSAFPARALTSQTLAPGASVKGYLYYPPGSYTGARGFLIEEESQEREGFDIQF